MSRIIQVTPETGFKSVTGLQPGDIILAAPGYYPEARQWPIIGTPDNPVTIRAQGKLTLDGKAIDFSGTPRAIFQFLGGEWIVEGPFDFENAHNGNVNGAGLRAIAGNLTVRNGVRVSNCDDGIMSSTTAGTIRLENISVLFNGLSPLSHNLYLDGQRAEVVDCEIGNAVNGQNVKIRNKTGLIRRCYIHDGRDGEIQFCQSKWTVDGGSDGSILDSVIMTRGNRGSGQNAGRVIDFGREDADGNDRVGLLVMRNTLVNIADPQQRVITLSSENAGLLAQDNTIYGSVSKYLWLRYGSSAGIKAERNRAVIGSKTLWLTDQFGPPPTTPPAVPTDITSSQTQRSIDLAWPAVPGADSYRIYVGGNIRAAYAPNFAYLVSFVAGRTYKFQLSSVDFAGNESAKSAEVVVIKQ